MTHDIVDSYIHRARKPPMAPGTEHRVGVFDIDITSLDSDGFETFPGMEPTGFDDVTGVAVVGQEDPEYRIVWNHTTNPKGLSVERLRGSGGDPTPSEGAAIGRVVLRISGLR